MTGKAILFVTRNGHSKAIAETAGKLFGADVFEIGDLVDRKGLFGYVKSGFQASTKKATAIRDPGVDLAKYATLVLVQPVWASAVCPPLRTWLCAHEKELSGKRVGLIVSQKGNSAERVRAAYEVEFGPLSAFTNILELDGTEEKTRKLAAFAALLA